MNSYLNANDLIDICGHENLLARPFFPPMLTSSHVFSFVMQKWICMKPNRVNAAVKFFSIRFTGNDVNVTFVDQMNPG